jgi:hypothetical protein
VRGQDMDRRLAESPCSETAIRHEPANRQMAQPFTASAHRCRNRARTGHRGGAVQPELRPCRILRICTSGEAGAAGLDARGSSAGQIGRFQRSALCTRTTDGREVKI